MGSLNPEEAKQELDDSGYVQEADTSKEDAPKIKFPESTETQLLDLSDDVLLYILQYCSPTDLKALGFTCSRLAALILDRTLWQRVDARDVACGPRRLRWFLTHGVNSSTTALLLSGYAERAKGCLGFIVGSKTRKDEEEPGPSTSSSNEDIVEVPANNNDIQVPFPNEPAVVVDDERAPRLFRLTAQGIPRANCEGPGARRAPACPPACPGPRVTVTTTALNTLANVCTNLKELAMDYCIIDCTAINISQFPKTLVKLSLKGTKCFNLKKSFISRIHDFLTELEELDLSYCEWVEPACMLPLSKMCKLNTLYMKECHKLTEFVAYASLATRYGFKTLKVLDLRGSPVGDSEVSALGWLPALEQLYLSPARASTQADHAHYAQDPLPHHVELDAWEHQEPEFFKNKEEAAAEVSNDENHHPPNNTPNNNNNKLTPKTSCILLERMIAEPVAPEEYFHVYQRFLQAPQIPNVPLSTPDEYRDSFQTYQRNDAQPNSHGGFIISNSGVSQRAYNMPENTQPTPRSKGKELVSNKGKEPAKTKVIKNKAKETITKADNERTTCDENGNDFDQPGPSKRYKPDPTSDDANNNNKNESPQKFYDDSSDDDNDQSPPKPKRPRVIVLSEPEHKWPDKCITIMCKPPAQSKDVATQKDDSQDESMQNESTQNESAQNESDTENNESDEQNESCKASTSKSDESANDSNSSNSQNAVKTQRYVRFTQNRPPVVVEEPQQNNQHDHNDMKHRILYVNVGRRRHAMYHLSMPICTTAEPVDLRMNNLAPTSRSVSSLIYASHFSARLDYTSLVTDAAIRRFGRADGENIAYVQIGPNGPVPAPYDDPHARPNRSNLRVLSVTGFRHISNLSLVHLATAAPHLQSVDFSGTSVTESGVEQFKSLRPDVEVKHSPFNKDA